MLKLIQYEEEYWDETHSFLSGEFESWPVKNSKQPERDKLKFTAYSSGDYAVDADGEDSVFLFAAQNQDIQAAIKMVAAEEKRRGLKLPEDY